MGLIQASLEHYCQSCTHHHQNDVAEFHLSREICTVFYEKWSRIVRGNQYLLYGFNLLLKFSKSQYHDVSEDVLDKNSQSMDPLLDKTQDLKRYFDSLVPDSQCLDRLGKFCYQTGYLLNIRHEVIVLWLMCIILDFDRFSLKRCFACAVGINGPGLNIWLFVLQKEKCITSQCELNLSWRAHKSITHGVCRSQRQLAALWKHLMENSSLVFTDVYFFLSDRIIFSSSCCFGVLCPHRLKSEKLTVNL